MFFNFRDKNHPWYPYYRDGTIYTGEPHSDKPEQRFTNQQVVIAIMVFIVVGGYVRIRMFW